MKEAAWLLSTALPEDGRRMIKGPGRSACFKGGVTYGYRECLRKRAGSGRSCDASSPAPHGPTDLRRASSAQSVVL